MCCIRLFMFMILFAGVIITPAFSSDVVYPTGISEQSEFKDLTWNRYTTDNFVIVSIDDKQGLWLSENLEKIKTWSLTRWGFNDIKFSRECRIFVVPNRNLMKKLFNLEQSKWEIRDELKLTAVWLVLDEKPTIVIPPLITNICFYEFENQNKVELPFWFTKGASQLNGNISNIHKKIEKFSDVFKKDVPIFVSSKMFTMTEETYKKE